MQRSYGCYQALEEKKGSNKSAIRTCISWVFATLQNVVGADTVLWYLNPGGQHWTLMVKKKVLTLVTVTKPYVYRS